MEYPRQTPLESYVGSTSNPFLRIWAPNPCAEYDTVICHFCHAVMFQAACFR